MSATISLRRLTDGRYAVVRSWTVCGVLLWRTVRSYTSMRQALDDAEGR